MKRLVLLLVIVFGFSLVSCVEVDTIEDVESITYDFVIQNYYEIDDDVSIADKEITVHLVGGDTLDLALTDDGVEVSGDGVNANLTLYTDKVGMYNIYITYEESMVHLQYKVEDFELLALINDSSNYFYHAASDTFKLHKDFWVDNYDSLDKWNLLIYWDYVGQNTEGEAYYNELSTSEGFPEGLNVRIVPSTNTLQNTVGMYLDYAKGIHTEAEFEANPPWVSSYEFVTFMRETVQYRGMNKRANLAIAQVGFGARDAVDIDLLLGDMYKIISGFEYKTEIDDYPLEQHIEYWSKLLYGGSIDLDMNDFVIQADDFTGLYEMTPIELITFSNHLVAIVTNNTTNVFDGTEDARLSISFKGAFESAGIYTYMWFAALYTNGIDTTALEAGIDWYESPYV